MARKHIKVAQGMLFIWLMLAGLILLLSPQNITGKFGFAFARIFRWPLTIGRGISLARTYQLPEGTTTKTELENHLANLAQQLLQEHQRVEEFARLRVRFPLEGAALVPASVVTSLLDASRSELVINMGRDDGVEEHQFVLANNSIIGTVLRVEPRQARVRLLTDPASKIEVRIENLKIYRVMYGTGANSAKIPNISRKHKIKKGLRVFACTKPGFLDTPLIIGTVTKCVKDDEKPLLWDITVEPVCDIQTLTRVYTIAMNPPQELRL